jgi:RNA polymerase sigma-70 factor, ECF subfamily
VSPPDQNLERLVRKAQQRDHEAFVTLAEMLRPRLWARALRYAPAPNDAEDLVQETLLRAYRHLPELHDPQTFVSWTLTILDRHAQRETAQRAPQATEELEQIAEASAAQTILEASEWSDAGDELKTAITKLSSDDREVIALRFGAGLNAPEIAAELKATPTAIRSRLCRALSRLRQMLGVKNHDA